MAQGTIDPATEIRAAKDAIRAADFRSASLHTFLFHRYALAVVRSAPPAHIAKEDITPPKYTVVAGDTSYLTTLADEVSQAIDSSNMPRAVTFATALLQALSRERAARQPTPSQRFSQSEQQATGADAVHRFLLLPDLAKTAYEAGDFVKASSYADELLAIASAHPGWPQGDALHYGNIVAGRVALQHSNISTARSSLLAAGKTSGSPRLHSFGPNMGLAADLLAWGDPETVLEYLAECKTFWKDDKGRLDQWASEIRQGKTPDFGTSLTH
ncbi:MAG: hypothetical protein LAP38_01325 [Acidobacteriia bacterium]|nr:hypothetical protein [Terriglobia bacterium]